MTVHQVNPEESSHRSIRSGSGSGAKRRTSSVASRACDLHLFDRCCIQPPDSVIHRVADRLDHSALSGDLVRQTYGEALRDDPDLGNAFRADLVVGLRPRSPRPRASHRSTALLQGFRADPDPSRCALALAAGPQGSAVYLQGAPPPVFQTDINPAAHIGRGIFLDHATGFVCGGTSGDRGRRSRSCTASRSAAPARRTRTVIRRSAMAS